ncbi:MAG: hypothetical protein ACPGJH_03000 [Alphaproteobacteria bacterium]
MRITNELLRGVRTFFFVALEAEARRLGRGLAIFFVFFAVFLLLADDFVIQK